MIHEEEIDIRIEVRTLHVARRIVPKGLFEVIVRVKETLRTSAGCAAIDAIAVCEDDEAGIGIYEGLQRRPFVIFTGIVRGRPPIHVLIESGFVDGGI